MKENLVFTFLLVILLIGCTTQPNLSTSIPSQELTPSNMSLTVTRAITATSHSRATLTFTPVPSIASTPQYTETVDSSVFVNTQDERLLRSNKYGFTITLPSDIDFMNGYTPDGDVSIFGAYLSRKHLADGGDIVPSIYGWVENQTDSCHSRTPSDPAISFKVQQVSISGNSYTKVYTPDFYDYSGVPMQDIEYMTYGTNFCVHFQINLSMYYFDRGDAQPGNMLPYVQDELESIISTFQWVKP